VNFCPKQDMNGRVVIERKHILTQNELT